MKLLNFKNISISILFVLLSLGLINSNIVSNFIWKGDVLFGDYNVLITWLECNYLGYDVYTYSEIEKCPVFNPTYDSILLYGQMWLNLPFNVYLKIFYLKIVPYLAISIFIFASVILINPKNFKEYLILSLCLLNPATIFAFERLGFDIFVFLFLLFLTVNRIFILNWILIFCLTFVKVYPAILGINIFLEDMQRSLRKNVMIVVSLIILSIIYFGIYFDEYNKSLIDGGLNAGKAGYHYLFSLNALPKIIKYSLNFNYILSILIIYLGFIFLTRFLYKKFNVYFEHMTNKANTCYGKIFILSGYLCLFCFVTFSNYFYREIFLILLLPLIIGISREKKIKIIDYLIIFIIVRYIFIFWYGFLNVNDGIQHEDEKRIFSLQFLVIISLKSLFDFFLMSSIASISILNTKKIIREISWKF